MTKKKDPKDYCKMGRPTKFNEELGDLICERIACHPVGLEHICKMYDDMPDPETIRVWNHKHPNFHGKYLRAKSEQAMLMVEQIDDLLPHEILYLIDEKGQKRIDPPSASMAIAKCNNRKWQAARLAPRIYGDQRQIDELKSQTDSLLQECKNLREKLDEKNKKDY
jgi:hypothetical protein